MEKVRDIKIAYIGGGSRSWSHNLMNDLAKESDLSGEIYLYDIDIEAAKKNEVLGNMLSARDDIAGKWKYHTVDNYKSALENAQFVVISILPGTFDEMESDVHAPEEYGIYQSVGDSTGPGGIVRALRTVPMFKEFAQQIEKYCPTAWVINFTNPMSICVRTLYKVFPKIKAFGCCHEVFGTQKLFVKILEEKFGIKASREEIDINVSGINHFTFLTEVKYKGKDLIPIYDEYINEHKDGLEQSVEAKHWANGAYVTKELVKFSLFKKYGCVAAAGDRHLAEFCPGDWYLANPETVEKYGFSLTTVKWRKQEQQARMQTTQSMYDGKPFVLFNSGEESVRQIKALLGLGNFTTNVNIPNIGQAEGLKKGAIVETNAYFSGDSVKPIYAGELPCGLNVLVERIIEEQEMVTEAALSGDYEKAYVAFVNNPNVNLPREKSRELFNKMLYNTRKYLPFYEKYVTAKKFDY